MKTLTVDDYHRVGLPNARPRTKLAYEEAGGVITLTPMAPNERTPARVRFEKRKGRTVAFTDQPISLAAIHEALAEFP